MSKLILETPDGKRHEFSRALVERAEEIARNKGISIEDALAQALANEQFLERLEARGAKLLYDQGGEVHEIRRRPVAIA